MGKTVAAYEYIDSKIISIFSGSKMNLVSTLKSQKKKIFSSFQKRRKNEKSI